MPRGRKTEEPQPNEEGTINPHADILIARQLKAIDRELASIDGTSTRDFKFRIVNVSRGEADEAGNIVRTLPQDALLLGGYPAPEGTGRAFGEAWNLLFVQRGLTEVEQAAHDENRDELRKYRNAVANSAEEAQRLGESIEAAELDETGLDLLDQLADLDEETD